MNIQKSTALYERWLASRVPLVKRDLHAKHQAMALPKTSFPFFRATFYRWAQVWPELCPELARTTTVLAVGDLHVENFGTWRDTEGRLIWGVNDFDEAAPMPFAIDLVRLASSALLAIRTEHLACTPSDACASILAGYVEGIQKGGASFVLAERNRWLRQLAVHRLRDPARFWTKLQSAPALSRNFPAPTRSELFSCLPKGTEKARLVHRVAGLGSLGRNRVTVLGEWNGGCVAREARPLLASAWFWARGRPDAQKLWYAAMLRNPLRVSDPFTLVTKDNWVMRRLAPDCSRIELADLPQTRDEARLLWAMGKEIANIHLASAKAIKALKRELQRQRERWLLDSASVMVKSTIKDWKEWRNNFAER